jgi:hypothetical protein
MNTVALTTPQALQLLEAKLDDIQFEVDCMEYAFNQDDRVKISDTIKWGQHTISCTHTALTHEDEEWRKHEIDEFWPSMQALIQEVGRETKDLLDKEMTSFTNVCCDIARKFGKLPLLE